MTGLRFFIDTDGFTVGESLLIEGAEFHHICDVIRAQPGEELFLLNGQGWIAKGIIEDIGRHRCTVRILFAEQKEAPPPQLFLGLSLLRPNHLEFAIEKGTEVGVDQFILFPTDKSERKDSSPSMRRRLSSIITAAMKQSGRTFRPEVKEANSLAEALLMLPSPRLFADLQEKAPFLSDYLKQASCESPLSVLIGPESGWSDREKGILQKDGCPVLLHSNVLRAETAAVVAAYTVAVFFQTKALSG
jgi:16S rRNA (uracil1498-N3)-methyltransferase